MLPSSLVQKAPRQAIPWEILPSGAHCTLLGYVLQDGGRSQGSVYPQDSLQARGSLAGLLKPRQRLFQSAGLCLVEVFSPG